jgi:endonuclease YncB( thermonuclease family)
MIGEQELARYARGPRARDASREIKSYGPDRYRRTLGEVFVDGKSVNLEMVKSGFAEVYRGPLAKGQNMEPYRKAEEEARKARLGMLSQPNYMSPRDWRKSH